MGRRIAWQRGLFDPGRRHLFVFAHQDDELPYAGLIRRCRPDVQLIWLTNGDGLAPEAGEQPEAYADKRRLESIAAMDCLGIGQPALTFLEHSEIAIYKLLARMSDSRVGGVPPTFERIYESVEEAVLAAQPDVVWTLAWQGGHPEHDLAHLCTARALRRLADRTGRALPLYELPAYELTFVVPLRFRPWRRAPHHAIELTPDELRAKHEMMACYPTQAEIIEGFERLIGLYGRLSALRLRPFDFSTYAALEQFAKVPASRDYTRSTHVHPRLDYIGDDYAGCPIRFERTLARIARAWGMR